MVQSGTATTVKETRAGEACIIIIIIITGPFFCPNCMTTVCHRTGGDGKTKESKQIADPQAGLLPAKTATLLPLVKKLGFAMLAALRLRVAPVPGYARF